MTVRPFCPKRGGTLTIAIGTSASAPQFISERDSEVSLFNSGTAIAFVCVTVVPTDADVALGASATTTDFPVAPGGWRIVSPGVGFKTISVIGSAANGNLYATPGHGGI